VPDTNVVVPAKYPPAPPPPALSEPPPPPPAITKYEAVIGTKVVVATDVHAVPL
jgi:hypothetical protein